MLYRRGLMRYAAAATAARAFSLTPQTRALYRALGNRFRQGQHSGLTEEDIRRGVWTWKAAEALASPLDASSRVLELGTGWTHFFGLFLRLLFPAKIVMFDVQDCRQLDALRMRFARLADAVDRLPEEYRDRRDQVRDTALEIAASTSFSQLYDRLGCEYVVEESGSLARFDDADFSMVFSVDVFEHVARDSVPDTIQGVARVLAPGGISAHTISVADHLAGFAPGMPPKSYAGFSDKMWRRLFENRVQYVNRMQACEFADQFASAGLALQDAKYFRNPHALDAIRPAGRFLAFDAEELEIVRAELVHTKPRA